MMMMIMMAFRLTVSLILKSLFTANIALLKRLRYTFMVISLTLWVHVSVLLIYLPLSIRSILFTHLSSRFEIHDTVLNQFRLYKSSCCNSSYLLSTYLSLRRPQGSVLGHLLFVMYTTLPLLILSTILNYDLYAYAHCYVFV